MAGLFAPPSDSSTMRAGGGVASPADNTVVTVWMDSSAVKIASPVAVELSVRRLSSAATVALWSGVGETSRLTLPENDTRPRFTPGVSCCANCLAAS